MFLLNSRLDLFAAPHSHGDPLFRSYGVNLPSSLTVNHSSTLGYSPRPPVSDYGTGDNHLKLRRFSRKSTWANYPIARRLSVLSELDIKKLLTLRYIYPPLTNYSVSWRSLRPFVSPSQWYQYRNINRLSIENRRSAYS